MALVPTYKKKSGSPLRVLLILLLVAAVVGVYVLQRELRLPPPAQLQLTTSLPAIGRRTVVTVKAREPVRGLVQVRLEAGGRRAVAGRSSSESCAGDLGDGPRRRSSGSDAASGSRQGQAARSSSPGTVTVRARRRRAGPACASRPR